jgi:hypothetical protein
MYGKKIAGIFLCLSFQAHGMLTVNQLPKKIVSKKDQILVYNAAKYRVASIENGQYNQSFFTNSMVPDTQFNVMSSLDHRSNIQFIRTNKYLYDQYVKKAFDGRIIYKNCLFTTIPFDFDFQTKALFHYAPQHEDQAKILLSIEDIGGYRSKMLKKFELHDSHERVMYFYKQLLSGNQIGELLDSPELFQKMLKKGLSPNNGRLMRNIGFSSNSEKFLRILLDDPRTDLNIQDENGNTILMRCILQKNIKFVKMLLEDKRANPNMQAKSGYTALMYAVSVDDAEIIKVLLADNRINFSIQQHIYYGKTALDLAFLYVKMEAIKTMLKDERIEINAFFKNFAYWWEYFRIYEKNPEVAQFFAKRVPFYSKLVSILMSGALLVIDKLVG